MNHEDCGAPSGRVRILMGSLSAPRLAAMFSSPTASPLPLFPPRLDKGRGRFDTAFPVRAATLKTPEAGPLPAVRAKVRASRATLVVRAHLRRRAPRPKTTDGLQLASSWTRGGWSLTEARAVGINDFAFVR
jgi:hypothetical protein